MARLRAGDQVARGVAMAFALVLVLVTVLVAFELWIHSTPSRRAFGWAFVGTSAWDPVAGRFGAAPFVYGTLVTSALALAVAVPVGLGTAVFLAELAPRRLAELVTAVIDLLAAVPSIVYGLIGLAVVVPLMRERVAPWFQSTLGWIPLFEGPAYGVGYLTAALVLAVMIVPFIVSVAREVLLAVPAEQREAALALGATRWEGTRGVVLPFARAGIFGAIVLALGRALGETMAVSMVVGNRPAIAASLFAPGHSMAAVIANEFTEATDDLHLAALVEVGLVLFLLTMLVNAVARVLIAMMSARGAGA